MPVRKRRNCLLFASVSLGCAALLLTAAPQRTEQRQNRSERGREFLGLAPPPDPEAAGRGKKIYTSNCAFCHGANANGAEGPDLVRSSLVLHDEDGKQIAAFLETGRPDRGMPSFAALPEADRKDIAAFLHERVEAAANRYTYRLLNVVTGNAEQGKQFFDSNCTSCHQASGDLAHIATKFEPAELQAQFLYPTVSTVQTTVTVQYAGRTINGKLKQIDDFHISMWGDDGTYHEWPRSDVQLEIHDPLKGHRDLLAKYTNADMHNLLSYLETLK